MATRSIARVVHRVRAVDRASARLDMDARISSQSTTRTRVFARTSRRRPHGRRVRECVDTPHHRQLRGVGKRNARENRRAPIVVDKMHEVCSEVMR